MPYRMTDQSYSMEFSPPQIQDPRRRREPRMAQHYNLFRTSSGGRFPQAFENRAGKGRLGNGHAPTKRAKREDEPSPREGYQARDGCSPSGSWAWISLPASRSFATWQPGPRFRQTPQSHFRSRLLLAPSRRLSVMQVAQVEAGFLATEVGGQQAAGRSKPSTASRTWMGLPHHLGMRADREGRTD